MKLTAALLTIAFLQVCAKSSPQVTLSLKNAPVEKIFFEIERQAGYGFLYTKTMLSGLPNVTIKVKNAPVSKVLNECFRGQPMEYSIEKNTIVITRKAAAEPVRPADTPALAPPVQLHGRVLNQSGAPLQNVSVIVVGAQAGTTTNSEGRFTLTVADNKNIILEFSSVGYQTQRVNVGKQSEINIVLEEADTGLNEVVIVGYGTQKRSNVTGSISTVSGSELTANPVPNVAQSMMGKLPGVFIKNVNGQPGDETAVSFNIRGFGAPLIVIDGITATANDFGKLNANDIEDISILKDAAAASVYGARAGNGVVLVKTKRGIISDPVVTVSSNFQLQHFLNHPHWVNSEQEARMENLANYNEGKAPKWTEEEIQKFADGSDPGKYPNTDWWGGTVRKYAPQLQQNISVRGGSERVKYYVSGGYFYQEAMLKANDTRDNRYTLRSNIDIALTRKLNMNFDLSAMYQDYKGPFEEMERGADQKHSIMTYLFRVRPYQPFLWPDPTKITDAGDGNPYQLSKEENVGYKQLNNLTGTAKIGFSYKLPAGLEAKANFSYFRGYNGRNIVTRENPIYSYDYDTQIYTQVGTTEPGYGSVTKYLSNNSNFTQQYFLTWDKRTQDHNVSALVGYEVLSDKNDWFQGSRIRYAFPIDYLFAGPLLDQANDGNAGRSARSGIISRVSYDYQGKYLFEFNSRYDASSLFPKATRWGFFPSVSVGWKISEEKLIKDNLPFLSNLKLRASYGNLGYDLNTIDFQFLQTYSVSGAYIYDGSTNILDNGIKASALPNPEITWEKMTTKNIGLDFSLWHILEGSFDYFYRLRSDVLGTRIQSVPNVVGASLPQLNYAKYDNRGWELSLNHRNRISNLSYNVGGNISWNREKTVYIDQNVFSNQEAFRLGNKNGQWTDNFWGYMTDGLFQSQEEINNWADIDGKNNATVLPGDVKFIDYNGDGKIDANDQVIIGKGDFPRIMYGINMSVSWKGIDFAMLWQGAGAYSFNLRNSPDLSIPFYANGQNPQVSMLKGSYVPEGNPWLPANTTNAIWPIYRGESANRANPSYTYNSQIWLINGAYTRLKSIELGYTLSDKLTTKWGIKKCRVYASGYNLLTFSALDFVDPEIDTHTTRVFGDYYPPVGTYNVGLSLQF